MQPNPVHVYSKIHWDLLQTSLHGITALGNLTGKDQKVIHGACHQLDLVKKQYFLQLTQHGPTFLGTALPIVFASCLWSFSKTERMCCLCWLPNSSANK